MDMKKLQEMLIADIHRQYGNCGYEECVADFSVHTEMVPMRDGVRLETMIFKPENAQEKYPVILERTCYPFWDIMLRTHGEMLAKRGFVFIYQYCRGQHGSEGIWRPNLDERNDGIDTVEWICSQSWAGKVGVWGRSYSALVGWAMADAVKGKVASMFLSVYGTDRFASAWQKGSFRHDVLTSWTMENAGFPITADYEESCRYMPQVHVDEALWGRKIDWYRDYIVNDRMENDYWQQGW